MVASESVCNYSAGTGSPHPTPNGEASAVSGSDFKTQIIKEEKLRKLSVGVTQLQEAYPLRATKENILSVASAVLTNESKWDEDTS